MEGATILQLQLFRSQRTPSHPRRQSTPCPVQLDPVSAVCEGVWRLVVRTGRGGIGGNDLLRVVLFYKSTLTHTRPTPFPGVSNWRYLPSNSLHFTTNTTGYNTSTKTLCLPNREIFFVLCFFFCWLSPSPTIRPLQYVQYLLPKRSSIQCKG